MAKRPHITEVTRKNLIDAFWKLYQIKPAEKISVREITEMAGYNRGTFYLYFKDVYDVLDNIERDLIRIIEQESERYSGMFSDDISENDVSAITSAAIKIFEICEYKPFILLSDRGDPRFEQEIKKKMHRHLEKGLDKCADIDEVTREYIIHFVISGVLGIIKKWYSDGMVIPVEEHLAAVCNVLFGSRYLLKKNLCD